MDENKRIKLEEINYAILPVCGRCTFSHFGFHSEWSYCDFHVYEHLKHSEPESPLSIHKYGSCDSFIPNGKSFQGFEQFVEIKRKKVTDGS